MVRVVSRPICKDVGCDLARRDVRSLLHKAERARRAGDDRAVAEIAADMRRVQARVRLCRETHGAA